MPTGEISFSSALRKRSDTIFTENNGRQHQRCPVHQRACFTATLHVISANLHSVMNSLFAAKTMGKEREELEDLARDLSIEGNGPEIRRLSGIRLGYVRREDYAGTGITVQIFDTTKIIPDIARKKSTGMRNTLPGKTRHYRHGLRLRRTGLMKRWTNCSNPMKSEAKILLDVQSISIMGKAGILEGTNPRHYGAHRSCF